ncbi:MAG: hypothetical protein QM710_05875 [Flavobacterium sp.]
MDFNLYFDSNDNGLLATTKFDELEKKMELGIFPKSDYIKVSIADVKAFKPQSVAFDGVNDPHFQSIKAIFSDYVFESVAIHNSTIDLDNTIISCKHLIIGDNVKMDLNQSNFINIKEVTFLSVKTYKGKISGLFTTVSKLLLWYENSKSNNILAEFPNLEELHIYNGSLTTLVLYGNQKINTLHLHNCPKLKELDINPDNLEELIIERCKNLIISSTKIRSIPPFKGFTKSGSMN